ETQLIDVLTKVRTEPDGAKRAALLNQYNHIFTENIYNVGLVTVPAALITNKRFKDVPAGAPVLARQWSEGNTLPQPLWIAKADQDRVRELLPGERPGGNWSSREKPRCSGGVAFDSPSLLGATRAASSAVRRIVARDPLPGAASPVGARPRHRGQHDLIRA